MDAEGNFKEFDALELRKMLFEIGEKLAEEGAVAEIAIFGGSAMLLETETRNSTKDIDYVGLSGQVSILPKVANEVGDSYGLEPGWLNNAVEIFVSDEPDYRLVGDFPPEKPGLRVFRASADYLLAMKIMSMRSSLESNDLRDIWDLVDRCGVSTTEEACELLSRFYPNNKLSTRQTLLLDDLFEAKGLGQEYSRALGW